MDDYGDQFQEIVDQVGNWARAALRWAEQQPLPLIALGAALGGMLIGVTLANRVQPKPATPVERIAELPKRARERVQGGMPRLNWVALLPITLRLLANPQVRRFIMVQLRQRRR